MPPTWCLMVEAACFPLLFYGVGWMMLNDPTNPDDWAARGYAKKLKKAISEQARKQATA